MTTDPLSTSHPNVAQYRRLIEAFNRSDLEAVSQLLSANITYTMPGRSPLAGRTHGLPAHLEMLRRARELSENSLRLEPRAVLGNDEYVLVYGRITAQRKGKVLDSDHCVVYRFEAGRVVEGKTVPTDQYAFDAFWS